MNAQEIFDTVAKHLAAQGRPAHKNANSRVCVYRSPDGLKCAAGVLILDEEYDPQWDERGFTVSQLDDKKLLPERLREHRHLIGDLQDAHDYADDGRGLVYRLREAAIHNDLSPAILDTLTFPDVWK